MRKGINRCGKYLTAIIGKFSTAIYTMSVLSYGSFNLIVLNIIY